jgi:hypothetical protein
LFSVFVSEGNVFTEALPSNDRVHGDTDWREGFIKYATELGSGVMIYVPSLIKIGSSIQNLIGGEDYTDTDGMEIASENNERRLKRRETNMGARQ